MPRLCWLGDVRRRLLLLLARMADGMMLAFGELPTRLVSSTLVWTLFLESSRPDCEPEEKDGQSKAQGLFQWGKTAVNFDSTTSASAFARPGLPSLSP